eukprot:2240009-Prymnesium_polylepis.2
MAPKSRRPSPSRAASPSFLAIRWCVCHSRDGCVPHEAGCMSSLSTLNATRISNCRSRTPASRALIWRAPTLIWHMAGQGRRPRVQVHHRVQARRRAGDGARDPGNHL